MNINTLIEKEKSYIDSICNKYNYSNNLRHLLYIIIPAFIMKYGYKNELLIKKTFEEVKIVCNNKENSLIKAYYTTTLKLIINKYIINKYIVIQNYNKINLIDLLDNLVHEFNHAINSINKEIKMTKNHIYLRTGLTYRIYKKDTLEFIKKDSSFVLEEIINTKQTEDIINLIKQIKSTSFIENTIYAINNETRNKYNSKSYFLESYICNKILNNKTFINTLEKLRLSGDIFDIEEWFDSITGLPKSYKELITQLKEIYKLKFNLQKKKLFNFIKLNKIKNKSNIILNIINTFDENVNLR